MNFKTINTIFLIVITVLTVYSQTTLIVVEGAILIGDAPENSTDGTIRFHSGVHEVKQQGTWRSLGIGLTIESIGNNPDGSLTFHFTDGNSFVTQSFVGPPGPPGVGLWEENGNNIYYNSGNVGIGLSNPTKELQISGIAGITNVSGDELELGIDVNRIPYINFVADKWLQIRENGSPSIYIKDGGMTLPNLGSSSGTITLHEIGDEPSISLISNFPSYLRSDIIRFPEGLSFAVNEFDNNVPQHRLTILNNGRIGIGTLNPSQKLDVIGNAKIGVSNAEHLKIGHGGSHAFIDAHGDGNLEFRLDAQTKMALTSTGRLGIGINNPMSPLHVIGSVRFQGANHASHFNFNSDQHTFIRGGKTNSKVFLNDTGGKVVIGALGTPTPGNYKLYIDGPMMAEEVKVAISSSTDWADDAFQEVPSLEQIKSSIDENSHLYEMPSADELVKSGYSVTDMDAKLLRQIEWLTIHVIKLSEENKKLKSWIEEISNSSQLKK